MVNKKALTREIAELSVLQTLSRAYAEIASVRMKKTRSGVLLNRNFLDSISKIFQEVLNSYREEIQTLAKKRNFSLPFGKHSTKKDITFLAHNGKTVAVFLSANVGLYGDIVGKTFEVFARDVAKGEVEATVIGRLGLAMFRQSFPSLNYTYFDFPDNEVRGDLLGEIMRHLVQYEEIHVYYGKFQSVITQNPSVSKISAKVINLEGSGEVDVTAKKYLFEPSLEKILMFFEGEIFTSLMDQVIRESQLAKFASRITAMTKAGENINRNLKKMEIEKLKLTHGIANKKQVNMLAAIYLR